MQNSSHRLEQAHPERDNYVLVPQGQWRLLIIQRAAARSGTAALSHIVDKLRA
jgi:hypothetical protein